MDTRSRFCANCGGELPENALFCPRCGTPTGIATGPPNPTSSPPTVTPKGSTPDPSSSGPHGLGDELRPITALFADVVGSTSLGEKLSPEEVKALIGECVGRMSRAVEEFGGTIQAYMGDGICGLFGVPNASEDDPERAARAALRILEVIGDYAKDIEGAWNITDFNVRVGINSGQTAVGLVGASDPQMVALGDTTNVAARLQSSTTPGTIAVGDATAKSLAHRFEFEPLGDIEVKGRAEPVKAWRLEGTRTVGQVGATTPLIGRDVEMSRLEALAQQLGTGRGGVLLLSGETGMGKTRLLAEFHNRVPDNVTWLEGQCLSYTGGSAYLPFVEMLRAWLGVEEGEAEVAVRTKLRARMSSLLGWRLPNLLPFLGRLLSVKLDPEAEQHISALGRQELAEELRRAYATWIEALSYDRPVVVAVEDLHWGDGPTRELAEDLLSLSDRAPVLLAATLRPDPASQAWRFRTRVLADFPHRVMELPLRPLSDAAAEQLITAVASHGDVDDTTTRAIVDRAEGNPLYIEELLRSLGERGALERGRRQWTMSVSAAAIIPAALENLLVARVDNLPPEAHRIAQLAAVIGRTFPARVLELLYENNLEEGMSTLLRGQIVREVRRYPELEYTFSHGMLQEAALSTLTLDSRREIYGRVGAAFEELFADSLEDRYEVLAFYYYRSKEQHKALKYLETAGHRAAQLGATEHAYELFERALKVAGRMRDAGAEERLGEALTSVAQMSGDRRSGEDAS